MEDGAFLFLLGGEMHRGYIKLWRKTLESGVLTDPAAFQLFGWGLLKASHKVHDVVVGRQLVTLQPGQFIFGRKTAAAELKTTEQRIRNSMSLLITMKIFNQQTTNKFSVISVVNWDTYQSQTEENNQQINQQTTNKQPTNNHKQECKEGKEENHLVDFALSLLNSLSGTSYRNGRQTSRLVSARCREGFTQDDFEKVIRSKVAEWKSDPKMSKYLRPETLFGTKFESYLQTAALAPSHDPNKLTHRQQIGLDPIDWGPNDPH